MRLNYKTTVLALGQKIVPLRFFVFVIVGASGVILHLIVLGVLFKVVGLLFWVAQTIATLVGTTNNFFLNNAITFRSRQLNGRDLFKGWISFNAIYAAGAFMNIMIASWFYHHQAGWVASALAGISVTTLWNFWVSSKITWRPQRSSSRE